MANRSSARRRRKNIKARFACLVWGLVLGMILGIYLCCNYNITEALETIEHDVPGAFALLRSPRITMQDKTNPENTPVPTEAPTEGPTAAPTAIPFDIDQEPVVTEPTATPEPVVVTPAPTAEPEAETAPTAETEAVVTPAPTAEPEVVVTPAPTAEPEVAVTPAPTAAPAAVVTDGSLSRVGTRTEPNEPGEWFTFVAEIDEKGMPYYKKDGNGTKVKLSVRVADYMNSDDYAAQYSEIYQLFGYESAIVLEVKNESSVAVNVQDAVRIALVNKADVLYDAYPLMDAPMGGSIGMMIEPGETMTVYKRFSYDSMDGLYPYLTFTYVVGGESFRSYTLLQGME